MLLQLKLICMKVGTSPAFVFDGDTQDGGPQFIMAGGMQSMGGNIKRHDRDGTHRHEFDRNKKTIYATQECCGICGKLVDKSLPFPHPLSKCIDHIIPVNKGGHPSAMENLQLAHLTCNRQKSDKLFNHHEHRALSEEVISNRVLPQSTDWRTF